MLPSPQSNGKRKNIFCATSLELNNNNNNNNAILIHCNDTNSIQFNGYLLTCRLNSSSANYKASTKAQIKHKNNTNTRDKTLKKHNKTNM
jgi:hypothetical protein